MQKSTIKTWYMLLNNTDSYKKVHKKEVFQEKMSKLIDNVKLKVFYRYLFYN